MNTPTAQRDESRAVSWTDFQDAVRYGADEDTLIAVAEITAKHAQHRWLGAPLALHAKLAGYAGYLREYEHGTVFWTREFGASALHGMIRDVWEILGRESSRLGMPVADLEFERATGTWHGRFERGRVSWAPATGPIVEFD
ncbi:LGFP repeat-containing protein [Agromyces sp. MMS24-JH15]|uniref:LGFP repeat-containing protein n=1 Tax=Agromyces sp. MMS24-JH15 TaxID=3243765 RepID=UPI003747F91D